jgi:type III secretory pathway lipoprotein EscJ
MLSTSFRSSLIKERDLLERTPSFGTVIGISAMRILLVSLFLIVVGALGGCSSAPVADDVPQREANEIVSVLRDRGIDAQLQKQKGGKGRYAVVVSEGDFGAAAAVLSSLGLPAERRPYFYDLVSQSGILPSSREVESLRLDRATAAELEDLLKGHPAIAASSVVVRSHGLESGMNPSVSAVVQTKVGMNVPPAEIRQLVARTVPGLKADDVVLSVSEQVNLLSKQDSLQPLAEQSGKGVVPFLLFWRVPEDQYAGLAGLVVGLLLLMGILCGLAGYILGQYFMSRQVEDGGALEPLESGLGLSGARLNRLEGPRDIERPEGREIERGMDEE